MLEREIDYLQFSAFVRETICIEKQYEHVPPIQWYKRGYRNEFGVRVYFGNPNSPKANLVCSGDVMRNLRGLGMDDRSIVENALGMDGTIARIDWSVTDYIDESLVTVDDVQSWFKEGLIESTLVSGGAKVIQEVRQEGQNQSETLYIGDMKQRGKKGIFRAYDKGIEFDLEPYLITRLELEERGEKAHLSAKRFVETNSLSGVFRSRFEAKTSEFERLLDEPAVSVLRGSGKMKKEEHEKMEGRWRWLLETVAEALKEAVEFDEKQGLGDARLNEFLASSGLGKEMYEQAVAYGRESVYNDLVVNGVNSVFFSEER
ncbi:MAG TPA: replication initiation factor domain-containing protein [Allocoleopsis sp.]